MGKHSEWRKLAKKFRRKRIRQHKAQLKEQYEVEEFKILQNSLCYNTILAEKNKAEKQQALEEAQLHEVKEREWLKVEEEAQKQFQEIQKKLAIAREERTKQNEKIKQEWEEEQKRRDEKKKKQEEEIQRHIKQQEVLNSKVEDFLEFGGDTPEHLKTNSETNPNKPLCPFFQKTSTCRFFDVCSRNHVRPGISRILLIPNFFSHYSLEKTENEHFTDSNLEFENHETNECYREFYKDVVPELETYGNIRLFVTCCNHETHLRGNVYVEFASTRVALKCYTALNGRWYGGKQLSVQFANIPNWNSAICGVHFSNRCPKGSSCNFIHPFRNPRSAYGAYDKVRRETGSRQRNYSETRNWRWSESPERISEQDDWEIDSNSNSKRRHEDSARNGIKKRKRSKSRDRDRQYRSSKHKGRESSSRRSNSSRKSERSRYS